MVSVSVTNENYSEEHFGGMTDYQKSKNMMFYIFLGNTRAYADEKWLRRKKLFL